MLLRAEWWLGSDTDLNFLVNNLYPIFYYYLMVLPQFLFCFNIMNDDMHLSCNVQEKTILQALFKDYSCFFTSLQHACVFLIIISFGLHHQIYCLYTSTIRFVTSENSTTCSQQYCVLICLLISDSDHLMFQIVRS